jgi:prepilin-type N-terminal cleavage/methylation domain-containing protein
MTKRGQRSRGIGWHNLSMDCAGFTLIEMAIVLVVLGILVSFGAGMIGPLTLRMKTAETRENINATSDAVVGYAAINNRLPTLAQFTGVARSPSDAWGKPVQYVFDNNLTNLSAVCNSTLARITVRICTNVACSAFTDVNNVAFMVVSGGGNYNNQTAWQQAVGAATMIRTYAPGLIVDGYAGDMNRAEEYDDIVKWVTLPELQTKLSCGRCSAYEIWNNLGAARYFRVNGNGCETAANNTFVSSIGPGGGINGFTDAACSLPVTPVSVTFTQAATTDANRNCAVNYANPATDR